MTPLTIACISLPGSSAHTQYIPAVELQEHFTAASALAQAHEACESLHQQAHLTVAQAHQEAEQIRQQAYQQGRLEAAQAWAEQQQALIEQTLDWHVTHTELEATLARHLDARIRTLVAVVLEEFVGEQHAADLMVQRVQQRLGRFLQEGAITLRVADTCHAQVREQLAAYPQVRVNRCAALKPTQAQVQTALFTLHIDLEQHLDSLLSRLKHLAKEPICDDYHNRSPDPQAGHPASTCASAPAHRRDAGFSCAIGA
jgi:flagellar biosynthesis/type III secretory pathway protein FliH